MNTSNVKPGQPLPSEPAVQPSGLTPLSHPVNAEAQVQPVEQSLAEKWIEEINRAAGYCPGWGMKGVRWPAAQRADLVAGLEAMVAELRGKGNGV